MKYSWIKIKEAVENENIAMIEKIGKSYNKPRLIQPQLNADEVSKQILRLSPGTHPLLGPALLDLAEKLK